MTNSLQLKTALRRWMEINMTRSMHDWTAYVKSNGLSMPQFRLLMQLYYQGTACGISQISDDMAITNPAASQLVEKLVQTGLLDRAEDPNDRRAKMVTISEKGREFVRDGIEQRYLWIDELTETLNEPERKSIAQALTVLADKAVLLQEHTRHEKI
jgi:MarR family transcriptional regulator, organic hydroperoxide resistance regulator